MLHLQNENDILRVENARLRRDLEKANKEIRVLNIQLRNVQENRDVLETRVAELLGEVHREPKALKPIVEANGKMEETPILESILKPRVRFDSHVDEYVFPVDGTTTSSLEDSSTSNGDDGEEERYEESGRTANTDFTSSWTGLISFSKSHAGYVIIKNNHARKSKCLDDFIFVRTVDGKTIVPPTPLPLGIVIPPLQEFTIHANHPEACELPGKSCILYRIPSFGCGKVTENRLLDEFGRDTANYVLCEFH